MQQFKPIGDVVSVSTVIATMGGWLPSIAAIVSIIWGVIRIIETNTVQRWLHGGIYDQGHYRGLDDDDD